MLKFIKELIIMLLVCLLAMLLLAVVFYDYIPARKVIPEVITYKANDEVTGLLADDIDSEDSEVVATFEQGEYEYEVSSSELNNYKTKNDYVPGRSDPFASIENNNYIADDTDTNTSSGTSTNTTTGSNSSSSSNSSTNTSSKSTNTTSSSSSKSTNDTDTKSSEYIRDKGTK